MNEKLEIGTRVKVVANESGHGFEIGEIVIRKKHGEFEHLDGRDWWVMKSSDYILVGDTPKKYEVVNTMTNHFKLGEIVSIVGKKDSIGRYTYANCDGLVQYLNDCDVEEYVSEPKPYATYTVSSNAISQFITIGNVTIAIPKDCPKGISSRHPEDEYSQEIGQALAQTRMLENVDEVDEVDVCW